MCFVGWLTELIWICPLIPNDQGDSFTMCTLCASLAEPCGALTALSNDQISCGEIPVRICKTLFLVHLMDLTYGGHMGKYLWRFFWGDEDPCRRHFDVHQGTNAFIAMLAWNKRSKLWWGNVRASDPHSYLACRDNPLRLLGNIYRFF